jgi:hypothetical protein
LSDAIGEVEGETGSGGVERQALISMTINAINPASLFARIL